jgi:Glycosyl hydrolases family 32 N-terminal domain
VLILPDAWAWDFWTAADGERLHLFYLNAPRDLGDPELRHRSAGVGHAVTADLRTWELLPEALTAGDPRGPDDLAIWTGCVVRPAPDAPWYLFYTGATDAGGEIVQSTCLATSPDLATWTRDPANPVLGADPRWYEVLGESWPGENWRDPWVYPDPGGDGWHMLVTARGRTGPADDRGVVGAAWSPDLRRWTARPPRSAPGAGFGQLEVMQREVVDGRPVLLFSCLRPELSAARAATVATGGIWAVTAEPGGDPFDVASAELLLDDRFYVGKLVRDRDGGWVLLAFHHRGPDDTFVGAISDPMPVVMTPDGLRLG